MISCRCVLSIVRQCFTRVLSFQVCLRNDGYRGGARTTGVCHTPLVLTALLSFCLSTISTSYAGHTRSTPTALKLFTCAFVNWARLFCLCLTYLRAIVCIWISFLSLRFAVARLSFAYVATASAIDFCRTLRIPQVRAGQAVDMLLSYKNPWQICVCRSSRMATNFLRRGN